MEAVRFGRYFTLKTPQPVPVGEHQLPFETGLPSDKLCVIGLDEGYEVVCPDSADEVFLSKAQSYIQDNPGHQIVEHPNTNLNERQFDDFYSIIKGADFRGIYDCLRSKNALVLNPAEDLLEVIEDSQLR